MLPDRNAKPPGGGLCEQAPRAGLFDPVGPTVEAISATIERRGRLSPATARRRARALLSWRLQILEPQKYAYLLEAAEGAFVDE